MRKSVIGSVFVAFSLATLVACGSMQPATEADGDATTVEESVTSVEEGSESSEMTIPHRFATAEEGGALIVANDAYFDDMSQNDIDFRMQRTGATIDELRAFDAEQVLDFSDADKALIDGTLEQIDRILDECGYTLPPLDEVTLVKTTMLEESYATAYTHGTVVYLGEELLDYTEEEGDEEFFTLIMCHELFHCLTRRNTDFRTDMYKLNVSKLTTTAVPRHNRSFRVSAPRLSRDVAAGRGACPSRRVLQKCRIRPLVAQHGISFSRIYC